MRNTRRTTLRSAAVVAGAATLLALPVGSAFADSPAVPERGVLPAAEPKPGVRAYVTTVKLADGAVAEVYRITSNHFEADILAGSTRLDTLVSKGGAASYGQNNGLHVVLRPNGTVTSWMDGSAKPKPKPNPQPRPKPLVRPEAGKDVRKESSVRLALSDGRIAKLVDAPNGKRAEISLPNGRALGVVDPGCSSTYHDGWTYKLVRDGERVKFVVIDGRGGGNSWVYDFSGRLIETYTVDPAGAGTPVLVASGGGPVAAGAAGVGFSVLRCHG
ncbi:hypothetical protein [Streptomyces avidinii]|uniref:Secreted protein n=1 Tax=Streptomyces avidinii TaxID=1895 RepID=A0ABS4LEZ4_STRAV|nr:hypothetical protein [Streptomyces avidinii]MBP2040703.1 hypothetical protein [Streptomyces avidinii]GGZ16498.1 hypothetical protein GCM10010343_49470 [Streptomyces avidinii]